MFLVRPDRINEPVYVITTVFNPIRYRSRWKLYCDFAKRVHESGGILYTVEVAFGEREFCLTEPGHPQHLQLRTSHELWIKENAINLGFQRLPTDWKYAGWCDADVLFQRHDIWDEVKHQLQHYAVVQPWSQSVDLGPNYEILDHYRSFAWCHHNDKEAPEKKGYYSPTVKGGTYYWHPGYSLFFRRDAFNTLGGMLDYAILGGGDTLMLHAIADKHRYMPGSLSAHGCRWYANYYERACKLYQNLGFVEGLVSHFFHGRKSQRSYDDRGTILVESKFNPETDIYRDSQGLWQLTENNPKLRDGIRKYFRQRNEDTNEA